MRAKACVGLTNFNAHRIAGGDVTEESSPTSLHSPNNKPSLWDHYCARKSVPGQVVLPRLFGVLISLPQLRDHQSSQQDMRPALITVIAACSVIAAIGCHQSVGAPVFERVPDSTHRTHRNSAGRHARSEKAQLLFDGFHEATFGLRHKTPNMVQLGCRPWLPHPRPLLPAARDT